jgi:hypothetical protein
LDTVPVIVGANPADDVTKAMATKPSPLFVAATFDTASVELTNDPPPPPPLPAGAPNGLNPPPPPANPPVPPYELMAGAPAKVKPSTLPLCWGMPT